MEKTYKAWDKTSIVLKSGLHLPGASLPAPKSEDELGKYEELVKAGLIVCESSVTVEEPAPAVEGTATLGTDKEDAEAPSEPAEEPLRRGDGIWNFNPKIVNRFGLKRLNEMIADVDQSIDPFDDKQEALAFLTHDFK